MIDIPSFGFFIAIFLGTVLISAFSVQKLSQKFRCCDPSLKQLIPVAFLTLMMPVFGAAFGAPDMGLKVIVSLTLLGIVGGLFWSGPFALWNHFRGGSDDADCLADAEGSDDLDGSVGSGDADNSDSSDDSGSSGDSGENPPNTD